MAKQDFSVLILAAGKATRFKSEHSKMLHLLAGRPLGEYVLRAAQAAGPQRTYMVIGHEAEQVRKELGRPGVTFIEQKEQRGTGDALLEARAELEQCPSAHLLVLVGDTPLLSTQTVRALAEAHSTNGAAATVLTARLENPAGYGRIVRSGENVAAIREEKVATAEERRIQEINSGILAFSRAALLAHLGELTAENAQKEYLLTDLVEIFNRHGLKVAAFPVAEAGGVMGVNDRWELAQVEKILRLRKAQELARDGVTVVAPESTYLDDEVQVGRDTVIEPGVSLRGATRVGRACLLRPYSTISDSILGDRVIVRPCSVISNSEISSDVTIGPFAHLRDGAVIESQARIGNFVEVKKSRVGRASKASHLTYLGDATLGANVNIGAGTVTCNYDGEKKNPTVIADGCFVGSGSMLVAPVEIGKGSYVGAGSTITANVPPDSLALGRAEQVTKEGWVRAHRQARTSMIIETRLAGKVTVLELSGRVTIGAAANDFAKKLREIFEGGQNQVVINLADVTYMDSSGLGALVAGAATARAQKGFLKLSSVPVRIMSLLEAARLHRAFEIHPDEATAVKSFPS
jgi:bifunctional UDP-N-acetylglucosamine pyrophosphorylase / glucosamine-1-phosphate N-acetyltransferase